MCRDQLVTLGKQAPRDLRVSLVLLRRKISIFQPDLREQLEPRDRQGGVVGTDNPGKQDLQDLQGRQVHEVRWENQVHRVPGDHGDHLVRQDFRVVRVTLASPGPQAQRVQNEGLLVRPAPTEYGVRMVRREGQDNREAEDNLGFPDPRVQSGFLVVRGNQEPRVPQAHEGTLEREVKMDDQARELDPLGPQDPRE